MTDTVLGPPKYLFLDLETTGLDPITCAVIEIAAVVTDYKFDLIPGKSFTSLVKQHVPDLKFEQVAFKMHIETGLALEWISAAQSGTGMMPAASVEAALLALLGGERLVLAGNNVESFDVRFLQRLAPEFCRKIHYRCLNASSIREIVASALDTTADAIKPRGPGQHRAMVDVTFAIEEMRAARALIQKGRAA